MNETIENPAEEVDPSQPQPLVDPTVPESVPAMPDHNDPVGNQEVEAPEPESPDEEDESSDEDEEDDGESEE